MLELADGKSDTKKELGYDLKDDLICFMRNDPEFYRKQYFPILNKFESYVKDGRSVSPRAFESLVNKAYECYKNKFPVEGLDAKLDEEMCQEVCNEIHKSETEYIKDGKYDE